jgi:hypothetical protein
MRGGGLSADGTRSFTVLPPRRTALESDDAKLPAELTNQRTRMAEIPITPSPAILFWIGQQK